MVSLVKRHTLTLEPAQKLHLGLYCIALSYHENQEGTLSIIFPQQMIEQDMSGTYILAFHPDLMPGTSLTETVREWNSFGYCAQPSLNLLPEECQLVSACFDSIELELEEAIDKHSKKLIASHIERILNYGLRFHDRQSALWSEGDDGSKDILKRFNLLLNDYFSTGNIYEIGIPMVAYFADRLHRSPNYFGDLIKKETGISAQEYIHNRIIQEAKDRISDKNKSINQIAFELGFRYPQHFSRFFKKMVGLSPNEFRTENNKGSSEE